MMKDIKYIITSRRLEDIAITTLIDAIRYRWMRIESDEMISNLYDFYFIKSKR
jgi:hypothetical protein